MTISARDGMTDMTGAIIDQSHLYGLLERIGGLGVRLHSVTRVDTDNGVTSGTHHEARSHSP